MLKSDTLVFIFFFLLSCYL
uniref:Uncharacterized protein n=1 Tax=Arundo donax TaxID=35708 RepID=A0A0A9BIA0_ARUDO